MDSGRDIKLEEKRKEAAKSVLVVFPTKSNYRDFNIVDEHGNFKYTGMVIGQEPHKDDCCSCPNFQNSNSSKINGLYSYTHGYAYQCKHIIAARDEAKKQQEQVKLLSVGDASKEKTLYRDPEEKSASLPIDHKYFEQNLVDRSLLL